MLKKFIDFTVTSKEKAVAAFIISAIGSYMVQNGLTLADLHTWSAVRALIVGVVTHQIVYWTENTTL